jgi:hypothetical protein
VKRQNERLKKKPLARTNHQKTIIRTLFKIMESEDVTIEVATSFMGVAIMVRACIAEGITYAGQQKMADDTSK